MAEVFKPGHFQLLARLAVIQIINDLVAFIEIDNVEMKLLGHRIDQADQILMVLLGAIDISLFVNQPRNLYVGRQLGAELLGAQPCRMHEIRPPKIVRPRFVLLPLMHRRAANEDYIFASYGSRQGAGRERERKRKNKQELFH